MSYRTGKKTGRPCAVPGCSRTVEGNAYTSLCPNHRNRNRRHGDPRQQRIMPKLIRLTEGRLKHLLARLKPADRATLERVVKENHAAFEGWLRAIAGGEDAERRGKFAKEAAQLLLKVVPVTDSWTVALRISTLFKIEKEQRRLFASDKGFRFQLVTSVRSLAPMTSHYIYEKRRGKLIACTRLPSQHAMVLMGEWLAVYSGAFTAQLLSLSERSDLHNVVRKRAIEDAFQPLRDRIEHRLLVERRRLRMSYQVLEEHEAGLL